MPATQADYLTIYETASQCSDILYVPAKGYPRRTPLNLRMPIIFNSTPHFIDRYLKDCAEFQIRASTFKSKRSNFLTAVLGKIVLPKTVSYGKNSAANLANKIVFGCFIFGIIVHFNTK